MYFTEALAVHQVVIPLVKLSLLLHQSEKPFKEFLLAALKKHGGEELVTVFASLM